VRGCRSVNTKPRLTVLGLVSLVLAGLRRRLKATRTQGVERREDSGLIVALSRSAS
jgi:MYXO-CTERM domain-containing protein